MFTRFAGRRNSATIGRFAAIGLALAIVCGAPIDKTMAADTPPAPKDELGRTSWGGLGWGIGIATNFDIGGKRVGTAEVIPPANIVRIKDASSNVNVSFVLEAHYFLRDYLLPFGNEASC